MKIIRAETWSIPVQFEIPYAVAYGDFERTTLVFLRLETDTGLRGYGSAGCDAEVTGETDATVIEALNVIAQPILIGADPFLHVSLLRQLRHAFGSQPSALATVDMALFDLLGRHLGLPLWKWFGGSCQRILTSVTIGISAIAETLTSAAKCIQQGFRCLKIKGGQNVAADIERVIRVREQVGPDIALRFDANQGYSVAEAIQFASATRAARIEFLEQPTPAKEPHLLGQVRQMGLIPIMADECLSDARSALNLVQQKAVDLFNIKLMKSGGLLEALQIDAISRAAGLGIMVGCMDESALGIAAGLHLALGCPAVKYADLDGHLGLIGDPAAGQLAIVDGYLEPPNEPGLGVVPIDN
jgi:L-alanine-DL-glutamate epimerase-like enolase superfamily enzyme